MRPVVVVRVAAQFGIHHEAHVAEAHEANVLRSVPVSLHEAKRAKHLGQLVTCSILDSELDERPIVHRGGGLESLGGVGLRRALPEPYERAFAVDDRGLQARGSKLIAEYLKRPVAAVAGALYAACELVDGKAPLTREAAVVTTEVEDAHIQFGSVGQLHQRNLCRIQLLQAPADRRL